MAYTTATGIQRYNASKAALLFAQATSPVRADLGAKTLNGADADGLSLNLVNALAAIGAGSGAGGVTDRLIYVTGDSRTQAAFSNPATPESFSLQSHGWANWVGPFSDGRARVAHSRNGGVGGDTSTMWLARMPAIVASGAAVYVTLISINDRGTANMTADQTKANMLAGLKMQKDAGGIVVVVAELPVTFLTGTQLAYHREIRRWIKEDLPALGYYIVDPFVDMVDPASTTDQPKAGMLVDDRHPAVIGGMIVGRHVGRLIAGFFQKGLVMPKDTANWLNPNPLLTGTNGTKGSTANMTGSMATSFTSGGTQWTGGVAVAAKENNPRGGEFQVITLSGTPTETTPTLLLNQVIPVAGLTPGRVIKAVGDLEWSGLAGVFAISIGISATRPEGTSYYRISSRYQAAYPLPAQLENLPYESAGCTITGTETDLRLRVEIACVQNVALAGTIKIGRLGVS